VRLIRVVANQTATSTSLVADLRARAEEAPSVPSLVVPALNSRLRHWLSDIDDAVSAACRQGDEAQALLESRGLIGKVVVGDSVPLLAIEDGLARFAADEIVISTLPPNRSHWLREGLDPFAPELGVHARKIDAASAGVRQASFRAGRADASVGFSSPCTANARGVCAGIGLTTPGPMRCGTWRTSE
jgi:hypothetical protein